jgi:hypothetical protein
MLLGSKPGTLGKICSTLGDAGVNILALFAPEVSGRGKMRMWVDRPDEAKKALRLAGIRFSTEKIVAMELDNTAGAFSEVAEKLGKAKINIKYAYAATAEGSVKSTVIMAVPDVTKTLRILRRHPRH